ncbi:MAG TPA: LamG-like jellyroll fold domain-containing protein [Jatrophihabitans sp.]|nr:LamG-like jellyroll fold domain-containing protein [Jatrophihabitans sp.]
MSGTRGARRCLLVLMATGVLVGGSAIAAAPVAAQSPPGAPRQPTRAGDPAIVSVDVVPNAAASGSYNGLALTPPMGFNDWNAYGCNITEDVVKQTADAFVSNGMRDAGYQYVNIDDCWQDGRTVSGNNDLKRLVGRVNGHLIADPVFFPSGMKALGDYIHARGLKFGLYSSNGTGTCQNVAGTFDHETTDANDYAAWGVDYFKLDTCNSGLPGDPNAFYQRYKVFSDALRASGRDVVFSICDFTRGGQTWLWGPQIGNLWRTTGDISANFNSMLNNWSTTQALRTYAGPGGWNDPDMLEIGTGGFSSLAAPAAPGDTNVQVESANGAVPGSAFRIGTRAGGDLESFEVANVGTAAGPATSLFAPASVGDTSVKVPSTNGFTAGNKILIDTGGSYESPTITSVGTPGSQTSLADAASSGDTHLQVASVDSLVPGDVLRVDNGDSSEQATIADVGTAAGPATTLAASASAGATNVKLASTAGVVVGNKLLLGTGTNAERATVTGVGTAAGPATTLVAPASVGDTNVKVASLNGMTVGDPILLDSGGNTETATITGIPGGGGAAGPRVAGRIGNAVKLDGGTEYVNLPTGIVNGLSDFTVSAWVNPAANATWSRVFDLGTGTTRNMFMTANAGGAGLRFAITTGGSGGEQQLTGGGQLPLNQWSHVAVTVSGTTGTLYLNGNPVATNPNMTLDPADLGSTNQNWIGRSQYDDPFLNATVDDFQIYNRALSAAEVGDLAGGQPGAGNVASYKFDEDGGATAVDSSGNGRDATIIGAAAGPANTTIAPVEPGDTNIKVSSTNGFVVGDQLELHEQGLVPVGQENSELATITGVGTAAGPQTTTVAPVSAGDTNIKLVSTNGFVVGQPMQIKDAGGAHFETATVSAIGTPAGAATTLAAPANAGATDLKVTSTNGFAAGEDLVVGVGADQEIARVTDVGTAGADGTGVTIAAPLTKAHLILALIRGTGTGVTLSGPLATAHAAGSTTRGQGTGVDVAAPIKAAHPLATTGGSPGSGITIRDVGAGIDVTPLTKAHQVAAAARDTGTGVDISSLSAAHDSGVPARGLGTGVTLTAPLASAHDSAVPVRDESKPGTGITFSPALHAAHPVNATTRGGGTGITLTAPVTQAHPNASAIGKSGLSLTESRTHFTLWALDSAPLLAGTNVADMAQQNLAIYLNKDVIALDQDPDGVQVFTISNANSQWKLRKPLANGDTAVAVFNAGTTPWTDATVNFADAGLDPGQRYLAKDLWSKQVRAVSDPLTTASVPVHGTTVYRVSSRPPSVTVPDPIVVNATSPGGAKVTYQSSAKDAFDEPLSTSCSTASGATFAIGDTQVTCTATDAADHRSSASFTVHVKGAVEQLNDQLDLVGQAGGGSFADQLHAVLDDLAAGAMQNACDDLDGYIKHVKSQSGKQLSKTLAATLVTNANRISAVIGC